MNLYYYIYYKLYNFFLKISKGDIPELKASIIYGFFIAFNVLAFYSLLTALKVIEKNDVAKVYGILFVCSIFVINHLLLIKGKKYERIKEDFDLNKVERFNLFFAKAITWIFFLLPIMEL